jgi:hypothetical protein
MQTAMQLIALLLVAITMTCSLGHALELPGKLQLAKEAYFAVQPIYYPGFTLVGGFAEIGSIFILAVLSFVTPSETTAFALTLGALTTSIVLHAIFWIVVQPVNKTWLAEQRLGRAGQAFFNVGTDENRPSDWKRLRDRWEYGHLARGILATAALMLLGAAIALS